MDIKKNWSMQLAVALPVLMIIFVAVSIYVPQLWAPKPQYSFVYVSHDTTNGYAIPQYALRVVDGKVTKETIAIDESIPTNVKQPQYTEPHLYIYNTMTRENKSITFEEAQALKLDDRKQSPDDFSVKQTNGYSGPFGGDSSPALYIAGHLTSQKLDLRGVTNPYDFSFVGWVIQ
jgi:hypothetical protein